MNQPMWAQYTCGPELLQFLKSVKPSQWPAPPMVLRLFRGSSARMCVSIFATNILSKKQSFDVTPSANFMTPSANPISGVWYESAHVSPILWWTGTSCNSEKKKVSDSLSGRPHQWCCTFFVDLLHECVYPFFQRIFPKNRVSM